MSSRCGFTHTNAIMINPPFLDPAARTMEFLIGLHNPTVMQCLREKCDVTIENMEWQSFGKFNCSLTWHGVFTHRIDWAEYMKCLPGDLSGDEYDYNIDSVDDNDILWNNVCEWYMRQMDMDWSECFLHHFTMSNLIECVKIVSCWVTFDGGHGDANGEGENDMSFFQFTMPTMSWKCKQEEDNNVLNNQPNPTAGMKLISPQYQFLMMWILPGHDVEMRTPQPAGPVLQTQPEVELMPMQPISLLPTLMQPIMPLSSQPLPPPPPLQLLLPIPLPLQPVPPPPPFLTLPSWLSTSSPSTPPPNQETQKERSKKWWRGEKGKRSKVDDGRSSGRSKCPTPQPEIIPEVPQAGMSSVVVLGFNPSMLCK